MNLDAIYKLMTAKHGKDGRGPRRARFSSTTTGIRLPDDIHERMGVQMAKNPELTYAMMIRNGLRLELGRLEGTMVIQELSPLQRK